MQHADQVAHITTLMARLDSGTNVDAGGLRRNPTSVYVDPELAARERADFFRDHPQLIGLSGDLPESGSFLTVDDVGVPILATRDADGTFRAFLNACRHRGVVLEARERGSARRFTCAFHSWTYDTAGALVGVPKRDHFGDVDPACHGLIELPAVERYGLLFIHPHPDGAIDLDEQLGAELAAELEHWGFGRLVHLGDDAYDVACNWKLAMDTFGETYHFDSLHANTLANVFHGNVQCYDTFGRNHRMLLCRRDIDTLRELPEDEWHITVAALPVYWLFPNVQLMPNQFGCYLVLAYPHPTEPGRHTSRITFYMWPDTDAVSHVGVPEGDVLRQIATAFGEIIRDEDYAVGSSQQRSAASGLLDHVVFGRNEPALHHYHGTYRAMLGMEPLPLLDEVGGG